MILENKNYIKIIQCILFNMENYYIVHLPIPAPSFASFDKLIVVNIPGSTAILTWYKQPFKPDVNNELVDIGTLSLSPPD